MNNGGDVLARGGRKASFPAAGANVTQEKWDAIFGDSKEEIKKENVEENRGVQTVDTLEG